MPIVKYPNKKVRVEDNWYLGENNDGDLIFYNVKTDEVVKAIDVITGAEDKKGNSLNNELLMNGNIVNVKAKGAVGDNTTDDTTAIMNAFDELAGQGGILFFPQGIYVCGHLPINDGKYSGITVMGPSGNTSYYTDPDQNGAMLTLAPGTDDHLFDLTNVEWFTIQHLGLFGNSGNNTTGDLIHAGTGSKWITVQHCDLHKAPDNNIETTAGIGWILYNNITNATNTNVIANNDYVVRGNIIGTGGKGIIANKKTVIQGNEVYSMDDHGIVLQSSEIACIGNLVHDNGARGILVSDNYSTIVGNIVDNNSSIGIDVNGDQCLVGLNIIKNNSMNISLASSTEVIVEKNLRIPGGSGYQTGTATRTMINGRGKSDYAPSNASSQWNGHEALAGNKNLIIIDGSGSPANLYMTDGADWIQIG